MHERRYRIVIWFCVYLFALDRLLSSRLLQSLFKVERYGPTILSDYSGPLDILWALPALPSWKQVYSLAQVTALAWVLLLVGTVPFPGAQWFFFVWIAQALGIYYGLVRLPEIDIQHLEGPGHYRDNAWSQAPGLAGSLVAAFFLTKFERYLSPTLFKGLR